MDRDKYDLERSAADSEGAAAGRLAVSSNKRVFDGCALLKSAIRPLIRATETGLCRHGGVAFRRDCRRRRPSSREN